jgi:hypothetical protein
VGALLLVGVLSVSACADGPPEPGGSGTEEPTASAEPTPEPTSEPSSTSLPDDELPGEVWESGPAEGDELAVVGVQADDLLDLRAGPGVDFPALGELEPLGSGEATGRNRMVDDTAWVELTGAGTTGWVNLRYLAYLGDVTDITSELGELPDGTDLEELGRAVAEQRQGDLPDDVVPEVVVVDGPHLGDLGEVTVDVIGFADDSVLGSRLHVFAQLDGTTFSVRSVEQTLLCARGVSDGVCV